MDGPRAGEHNPDRSWSVVPSAAVSQGRSGGPPGQAASQAAALCQGESRRGMSQSFVACLPSDQVVALHTGGGNHDVNGRGRPGSSEHWRKISCSLVSGITAVSVSCSVSWPCSVRVLPRSSHCLGSDTPPWCHLLLCPAHLTTKPANSGLESGPCLRTRSLTKQTTTYAARVSRNGGRHPSSSGRHPHPPACTGRRAKTISPCTSRPSAAAPPAKRGCPCTSGIWRHTGFGG